MKLIDQLNNVVFLLNHAGDKDQADIVSEAIREIKSLQQDLKDEAEAVKLLEQKIIRMKVRSYNEH